MAAKAGGRVKNRTRDDADTTRRARLIPYEGGCNLHNFSII